MRFHISSIATSPARARYGRIPPIALCLGLALYTATAHGQAPPSPSAGAQAGPDGAEPAATSTTARADALFTEGLALLKAESFALACAKFEESHSLDPAPGTLFNLATCEEGRGRFATAARRWREAATLLPADDSRRPKAEKNAAEAEGKAARLVLRPAPQAPPGTAVTLDGRPLGAAELAAAILVDPGDHRIVVTAPGYEPRDFTTTAGSGESKEVSVTPGPAVRAPKATPPPAAPTAPAPFSLSAFLSQHKASFATLGAGIALAAAGTGVASDIVSGRYSAFVQKCNSPPGCTHADKDAMAGQGIAVNVLFATAGAAGLAAVGIFVFAEREPAARPGTQVALAIGPMGASLVIHR